MQKLPFRKLKPAAMMVGGNDQLVQVKYDDNRELVEVKYDDNG